MAVKRSPGCSCCGAGCDILNEGYQFINGVVSKSLGTSLNNSILTIVLDQAETVQALSWTGTQWTTGWTVGQAISGTDGWTGTDSEIVSVDGTKRAGASAVATVGYFSRTVEETGEWSYDWQTKVDTAWVQVWVNGSKVADHSENGVAYNTETITLLKNDTIEFRVYSPASTDEASVGDIVAAAFAAAPSPGYNGDTIDLVIGAIDTLTFGIEDIRTYTAEDLVSCPTVSEKTSFERRFYVTDGTRKFLLKTIVTEYLGENKADQNDVWTPLDFPIIKFRDGIVEINGGVEWEEGGYNIARTVTYAESGAGGFGTWIPYSIPHDGETLTLTQTDDIRIKSIDHEYIEADCDCSCAPFKTECPKQYTCPTVSPHAVAPYEHALSISGITLSTFSQEQFWGCSSETTWGATEDYPQPDTLFYGVDELTIEATYGHRSFIGEFIDAADLAGGSCEEGNPIPGNVCTIVELDNQVCSGFPCSDPLAYTREVTISTRPQDGKWLCGPLGENTDFVSISCGSTANCPTYEEHTLTQNIYYGCPDSTLNPVSNCDGTEDLFADDLYTQDFSETDACYERRVSTFSGSWSPDSHAQRAETFIVSELDVTFSLALPAIANHWRGDRVYGNDPDNLFGGGIWEKSQADAWVFKDQQFIPELNYDPDPSDMLNDLIAAMAGADQAYYYDVQGPGVGGCGDWGGTPPGFTSEDWTGFLPGALGPQTTFYTTGSADVIISAITGWCGNETTNDDGTTDWFEWTAEKDCEVVIDWNHTQLDQFMCFTINGGTCDYFSTFGVTGNGSTTIPCVQAGDVVRVEFWTGTTAATGIYVRGITVNEVASGALTRWKIEPDGTEPVEVTADPHPWTQPTVEFGMGAKVTISWSDTDATSGTSDLAVSAYTCSIPWDCDADLPGTLTDPADPTICGTYTKSEDFTVVPTDIVEVGTDDGTWSDALATCSVEASMTYSGPAPPSNQEWYETETLNTQAITRLDVGSTAGCTELGEACRNGYTTTSGNIYYWEVSDVWDRDIEMETRDTTHKWWTVDATSLYGNITNESCVVDFAKKWNDCWSGFSGPTVVFSGSDLAYSHDPCNILSSVSVTSGSEVELPPGSGAFTRSVTKTVSRTSLLYSGITLTASPKTSFPS